MNKAIKKKWVAALRSGDYTQTKGLLRRTTRDGVTGFCCLGVLCNLHAQAHPRIAAKQTKPRSYMDSISLLPRGVAKWAGVLPGLGNFVTIDGEGRSLGGHNDQGRTFKQIADAIEAQL